MKKITLPLTAFLLFLALTGIQLQISQAGMIDKNGMKPWEICGLCHNLNGISTMAKFPKLAGQKASYIEKQLRDFKNANRHNDGGQMEAIVQEVMEADIPFVAHYFAKLNPPKPGMQLPKDKKFYLAKKLFEKGDLKRKIPACITCHISTNETYKSAPLITSQHALYLKKQLSDFKYKDRQNDPDHIMQSIAGKLTEEDIANLAEFIANQSREMD